MFPDETGNISDTNHIQRLWNSFRKQHGIKKCFQNFGAVALGCAVVIFANQCQTILQHFVVGAIQAVPDLKQSFITAIAVVDTFFLSYAFITYVFAYFGKNTKVQDMEK